MSWEGIRSKLVSARKEYTCDHYPYLKEWWEAENKEDYSLDETVEIEHVLNQGDKIEIGEKHWYAVGKFEGEFVTYRAKEDVTALLTEYDYWMD